MAAAKMVTAIEPTSLEWLKIEDDAGKIWHYSRVGATDLAETPQVEGHLTQGHAFRASLIRDNDGHPRLRSTGPGLPHTFVLEYIEDPNSVYLTALGLPGKAEYALVV